MGVKKVAGEVGSGIASAGKNVGKGVVVVSTAIYNKTFLVAQIVGLSFMTIGLVIIVVMSFQKFSAFNMKALFKMITGVVFALVGVILIGVSYGIRWKRRMVDRVTAIETKWKPARRTVSSLKRAYNINKCSKLRTERG